MSIVSSSIQCHNVPTGIELLQEKENGFGILTIKTAVAPLTKTPSLLLFTMDTTGSMDEPSTADNNTTKMHYLKATFANMLRYLASLESPDIYIQVNCFDTEVRTVIQPVNVTKDNCAELIQIVQAITADGLTAIDKPLREAEKQMIQYKEAHPEHNIVHFFMTDGTPTSGETKTHILAGAVNDSFINLFIGFGENHNAELLRQCSSKKQASYLFIDNAENTAMFYGEALHQILYPAITNVRICIENGSIYDWKTNTWTETLCEDAVIGDCEKMYHLRQNGWGLMTATVCGTDAISGSALEEEVDEVPTLIDTATGLEDETDLTLYLFRQEVMELLFDATQYASYGRNEKRIYRENLERLFRVMRRFMREHDLDMDPFMLRLCNDVKVTHSTLNSNVGLMYSLARQTSQGRQQLFSPSNREDTFSALSSTPMMNFPENRMGSAGTMGMGFWEEGGEKEGSTASTVVPDGFMASDELTQYAVEDSDSQCYTTQGIMDTVRELSTL